MGIKKLCELERRNVTKFDLRLKPEEIRSKWTELKKSNFRQALRGLSDSMLLTEIRSFILSEMRALENELE